MKAILLLAVSLLFINWMSAQKKQGKKKYYCAPCGCENDGKTFDEGGKCAICKMGLLEVGTFNFELNDISKNNLILYTSNKRDNKQQLYYKKMNVEKERSLGEGSSAKFSADGKDIVFMRGESIWIYNIAANKFHDLSTKITLPGLQTPSWNLTGNSIIFSAGTFPDIGIYQFNLETEKTEPLIISPGLRYGSALSPDGKKIAYRCVKGDDKERQRGIAIFDLSTKEEHYVCNIGEYCNWSPDGTQLTFHWPDSGSFCIYTVNVDGSHLRKIAGVAGSSYEMPAWRINGEAIYFQTNKRRGNWEIWGMKTDGSDQKPVIWK
jgi:Tol biopolymer transport system component